MAEAVKLHVKKGDTVVVLAGKDKGKEGKVTAAFPKKSKVTVEGVNLLRATLRVGSLPRKLPSAFPT